MTFQSRPRPIPLQNTFQWYNTWTLKLTFDQPSQTLIKTYILSSLRYWLHCSIYMLPIILSLFHLQGIDTTYKSPLWQQAQLEDIAIKFQKNVHWECPLGILYKPLSSIYCIGQKLNKPKNFKGMFISNLCKSLWHHCPPLAINVTNNRISKECTLAIYVKANSSSSKIVIRHSDGRFPFNFHIILTTGAL